MTMGTALSRFGEAMTSDGFWKLAVQSRDSVVGHIFRVDRGEYAYFAGRFNGLTITFQGPEVGERLKERVAARGKAR
jgi:hypothetical protein